MILKDHEKSDYKFIVSFENLFQWHEQRMYHLDRDEYCNTLNFWCNFYLSNCLVHEIYDNFFFKSM